MRVPCSHSAPLPDMPWSIEKITMVLGQFRAVVARDQRSARVGVAPAAGAEARVPCGVAVRSRSSASFMPGECGAVGFMYRNQGEAPRTKVSASAVTHS
eukprot:scaffold122109_cov51-Phaeocystis_antarctica.AAC.2